MTETVTMESLNEQFQKIENKMMENHVQLCQLVKKMYNELPEEKKKRINKVDDEIESNLTYSDRTKYESMTPDEQEDWMKEKRLDDFLLKEEEKKKEKQTTSVNKNNNSSNNNFNISNTNTSSSNTSNSSSSNSSSSVNPRPVVKQTWTGYKKTYPNTSLFRLLM